jgi:hypothetical protein
MRDSREEFPRLGAEEERLNNRGRIIIMAGFYSVLVAFMVAGIVIALVEGYILLLILSSLFGAMVLHQALHYLRDINARPVQHEGDITRKWHKGNFFLFFFPSYYIMVERKVFTLSRREYGQVLEDDLVRVHHFPYSLTVERLERYDTSKKDFVLAEGPPIYQPAEEPRRGSTGRRYRW